MTVASDRVTRDAIWNGALSLWQPARGQGYRFNLDPILLAGFCAPAQHVVDLGAGCGVIGLLLLGWKKATRITAVEVQADLAALARANAAENGAQERFEVIERDLREMDLGMQADAVVLNPPYFPSDRGRSSPDMGRDQGRHERNGTLADFVRVGARLLAPGGRLTAIVRFERGDELSELIADAGLGLSRRRCVRTRAGGVVRHVLLEAMRVEQGEQPPRQEPDLIVHRPQEREFTDEVRAWVEGP